SVEGAQITHPGYSHAIRVSLPELKSWSDLTALRHAYRGFHGARLGTGMARQEFLDPLDRVASGGHGPRGQGFRSFGIRVREEDAFHRLSSYGDDACVGARRGHKHGMATPVDVHLDRINVEPWHQPLKITEHSAGQLAAALFGEQTSTFRFGERGIKRQDVLFLPVVRLIAHHPVSHNE